MSSNPDGATGATGSAARDGGHVGRSTPAEDPGSANGAEPCGAGRSGAAPPGTPATLPPATATTTDTHGSTREAADVLPGWIDPVTRPSVALVALAAGLWSVDHLAEVSRLAGTGGRKVWLLPVAVDGLASTASLVLYRAHRLHQPAGPLAWLALVVSLTASVAGNIVATYPELVALGPLKVAVGATPPLSLALALHLLLHQSRPRRSAGVRNGTTATATG